MAHEEPFLPLVDLTGTRDLTAGAYGAWHEAMQHALNEDAGMDVPCGACTACCRSSYFIHIGAHETDTLANVPAALLFDAPGRPGDRVMGFDEQGRCPMLVDDACSIYAHRPLTCRRYDCRVFTAADLDPAEDGKAAVAARTRRWRFSHEDDPARRRHAATARAARYLMENGGELGAADRPANLTQIAVLAVHLSPVFEALDDTFQRTGEPPAPEAIRRAVASALDPTP